MRLIRGLVLLGLSMGLLVAGASISASRASPLSASTSADLHLIGSDAQGIELEFSVSGYSTREVVLAGESYDVIEIAGLELLSEESKPEVPFEATALGIPPQARVTVEVLELQSEKLPGTYDLLPHPSLVVDVPAVGRTAAAGKTWPMPAVKDRRIARDASVYSTDAFFPGEVVKLTEPAYLRSQRLIGVQFYPVQYNPRTGGVELVSYVKVRLNLVYERGVKTSAWTSAAEPESFEALLQNSVLNYPSARQWRFPRSHWPNGAANCLPVPGYKVAVDRDGIYRLTYDALQNAGLPIGSLMPSTLQMFHLGEEMAIQVVGEGDGSFDPGDYILFWGEGIRSKYTTENIYWLTYGQEQGLRMAERDGTPSGSATVPSSTQTEIRFETDVSRWSLMPGADDLDRWYWAFAHAPGQMVETAPLGHVATVPASATLEVALVGYTSDDNVNPDHHVEIYVNDHPVGETQWDGIAYNVFKTSFSQSYLGPGDNEIRLEVPGDTGAAQETDLLDWFEVSYQHAYEADGDKLRFGGDDAGNWEYNVAGFAGDDIEVFDISVSTRTAHISPTIVVSSGPSYTLRFEDSIGQTAQYWAQTTAQRLSPLRIEVDVPSDWMSSSHGADYIIIAYTDFYTAMEPLLEVRTAQGYRATLVDVQDVYDEFGFGIAEPYAIRAFLDYAYHNWVAPAPSYVLLVGDGHFDPKDNLGYGLGNYIPAYLAMVDPWIGETAADNRYVSVEGDDLLPEMYLGRVPANTPAEAIAVVNKILAYESLSSAPWMSSALFVTDDPDAAGDFYQFSDDLIEGFLPSPYTYTRQYLGLTCPSGSACRSNVNAGINEGTLLVNYVGHGSVQYWAGEKVFQYADIAGLTNGTRLPVFLPMTCLEGSFHYPYLGATAIGEGVVVADGKGGIASWSPTGFGVAHGHDRLDKGFFQAVFFDGVRELGPATYAGKLRLFNTGANLDEIDTYHLFGDPALRINAFDADVQMEKTVEPEGQVSVGDAITYTLSFTNAGPELAYDVVLMDVIPPQLVEPAVVYSSSTVLSRHAGITFAWTISDLLPHTGGKIQIRAVVSPSVGPGLMVNEAEVFAGSDISRSNNVVSVTNSIRLPDLVVDKTGPTEVAYSQTITYTIAWGNQGVISASGVCITDTLPSWVEYVGDASGFALSEPLSGVLIWEVTPDPVPSSTQGAFVLTGWVTMDPAMAGPLVNQVQIGSDTPDYDLSSDRRRWSTDLLLPDLGVLKTGPAWASFDSTITYTVVYSNAGDWPAQSVVITDLLPASVTYVGDDSGLAHTEPTSDTHVWQVGPLSPGSGDAFHVVVRLGSQSETGPVLTNLVRIGTTLPDPISANNESQWATSAGPGKIYLPLVFKGPAQP